MITLNFADNDICFQDPAGIFDLIEVVGNGTYGQVYKVGVTKQEEALSVNYIDMMTKC